MAADAQAGTTKVTDFCCWENARVYAAKGVELCRLAGDVVRIDGSTVANRAERIRFEGGIEAEVKVLDLVRR